MNIAPVELTVESEQYLRSALKGTKEGMEPALVWSSGINYTRDASGKIIGAYEGTRVLLGWYKAGDRPRDSFFELCGYKVSIMHSTLENIIGKTISLKKVEMLFDGGTHHEHVLVAVDGGT